MTCFARRNRLGLAVAVCSVMIASAACAPGGRAIGGDPFRDSADSRASEIRVRVRNSNFNGGTIYAVGIGTRRRLGRVEGASQGDFRMPWSRPDQLRFEIDVISSRTCMTRTVFVQPGETWLVVIDSTSRPRAGGVSSQCDVRPGG